MYPHWHAEYERRGSMVRCFWEVISSFFGYACMSGLPKASTYNGGLSLFLPTHFTVFSSQQSVRIYPECLWEIWERVTAQCRRSTTWTNHEIHTHYTPAILHEQQIISLSLLPAPAKCIYHAGPLERTGGGLQTHKNPQKIGLNSTVV